MSTSKVIYKGDLRTESTHLQSGTTILTDAPTDNHGRGEAFSPTDMVANSLATCMFSIMGIKAKAMNIDLNDSTAEVTKIMQAEPRKISEIVVNFVMNATVDDKLKIILERAAMTCPVFLSLHPDIKKTVTFNWN
ncbi:MAG TPA: OsmC family protein [Flavobacterium sp.]|nr:OsmC family protein [Flavobacterium sp.]